MNKPGVYYSPVLDKLFVIGFEVLITDGVVWFIDAYDYHLLTKDLVYIGEF